MTEDHAPSRADLGVGFRCVTQQWPCGSTPPWATLPSSERRDGGRELRASISLQAPVGSIPEGYSNLFLPLCLLVSKAGVEG